MSLIHEALKKVERQRQVGTAPTLDSPQFRRHRRAPRWPWLLLLVLIFLVAGAWIWRVPLVHNARSVASQLVGSNEAGSGERTTAQAAPNARQPAPGVPAATIASNQVQADGNQSVGTTPPIAGKTAEPALPGKAKPEAQATPGGISLAPANVVPAKSEQAAAPTNTTSNPHLAEPAAPTSPATKSAAVGQLKGEGPPMYWELPYAQRRDIPELSISMHMYTEKPAERFVIINGVRQVEGDTLPSGLKLIAINPDSITLDKDGQHFRVPRRGSH